MSKSRLKSLSNIVHDSRSALGQLAGEAQSRLDLADQMRRALPAELTSHLVGCNLRDDGTLIILTSGPEWAARFRFESSELLRICREFYPATARVRVRVAHAAEESA
jgi:hypothetical protein